MNDLSSALISDGSSATGLVLSAVLSVALGLSSWVAVRHWRAIDDLRRRVAALEAAPAERDGGES